MRKTASQNAPASSSPGAAARDSNELCTPEASGNAVETVELYSGDEDDEDGKSYLEEVASPEESHESVMEQEAEADIEEQSPESDAEPSDVAPWDDV